MRPFAVLTAAFSVVALSLAPNAVAVPSLTGTVLSQHTFYTGPIAGNCTAGTGGSTSYSMDHAGTAHGPYQGTFTEHIDVTVGPQTTVLPMGPFPDGFDPQGQGPDDFIPAGQLLTLTADFTITSAAGNVTGTKSLTAVVPADSTHAGSCREWAGEAVPGFGTLTGSYEDVRAFDISYEATITTPDGDLEDEGVTDLQARQGRATNEGGVVFDVNDLGQSFDSVDDDGDGDPDTADNCPTTANPGQENNDGDTQGDVCDADDDNDGDLDTADNCPTAANPGQENNDGDSQGDVCDADDDNDGDVDTGDNCPTTANPDQANNDGDAQGDACDADDDGDGDPDTADNCVLVANPDQANTDGDSQGNACDADDDNDGVADSGDACPTVAASTANGCPAPPPPDADGDGRPDAGDNCPSVANAGQENGDGDTQGDACDVNDDNDGVADAGDACPTVAGTLPNGCPDTTAPTVPDKGSVRLNQRTVALRIGPFAETVIGSVSVRSGFIQVTRVGSARRMRIKLGPKAFQAPAGQALTLKFKLPKKVARAVRKLKRLKLTATVTVRDAAGNVTTDTVRVTLKPKRA